MDKDIVISIKTILFTLLLGGGVYLLIRLGPIIGLLAISLLTTISLEHTVKFFMKQYFFNKTVSRPVAVLITYGIVISTIVITISVGLDPVISQSEKLINQLMQFAASLDLNTELKLSVSEVLTELTKASGGVLNFAGAFFGNIATLMSLLILSVYISLDWENLKRVITNFLPAKYKKDILEIFSDAERNVGVWLKGQIMLMVLIGSLSYIVLLVVGVDYSLALGLMAGLLEIVPILGPTISAIVAAVVAFSISPLKAAIVLLAFFVIQQLEGNILVPKVMEKVSGFSPIIILIALLIGSTLFGILGAVIALPVLMIMVIIVKKTFEISQRRKK